MQHHWRNSVSFAVDLEAMGVGGKSTLFQVCFSSVMFPMWMLRLYLYLRLYQRFRLLVFKIFFVADCLILIKGLPGKLGEWEV